MEQATEFIVKETVTEVVSVDKQLQERIRSLVDIALTEAESMLQFGLADQKLAILRTVLTGTVRSVGRDFTQTEDTTRIALNRILESQREIKALPYAVDVTPIPPRVDDSDEGTDD